MQTKSWHFRYYCWIRSLYTHNKAQHSSLCGYFHTIFTGTILTILFSPLLVSGYFWTRLFVWLANRQNFASKMFDHLYNEGMGVRDYYDDLHHCPVMAWAWMFFVNTLASLICLIFLMISCGAIFGLPFFLAAIWSSILWVGWFIFNTLGAIGYFLFDYLWQPGSASNLLLVAGAMIGGALVVVGAVHLFAEVVWQINSSYVRSLTEDQYREDMELSPKKRRFRNLMNKVWGHISPKCYLFIEYLKAVKQGVCPLIQFVENEKYSQPH